MQIATLIRGFVMIRLLMCIVLAMKERKICLTLFLQFVILSPSLYNSSTHVFAGHKVILKCTCTCCGIHPDALQSLTGSVEVPIAWSVIYPSVSNCRSQWPRGLWRGSAAARLLELWVRIPPGHGCLSLVKCCVLSGRLSASG